MIYSEPESRALMPVTFLIILLRTFPAMWRTSVAFRGWIACPVLPRHALGAGCARHQKRVELLECARAMPHDSPPLATLHNQVPKIARRGTVTNNRRSPENAWLYRWRALQPPAVPPRQTA